MSASHDQDDPIEFEEDSNFELTGEIVKMEIQLIVQALVKHQGDVQRAADDIGVSKDYLLDKMNAHNIQQKSDS